MSIVFFFDRISNVLKSQLCFANIDGCRLSMSRYLFNRMNTLLILQLGIIELSYLNSTKLLFISIINSLILKSLFWLNYFIICLNIRILLIQQETFSLRVFSLSNPRDQILFVFVGLQTKALLNYSNNFHLFCLFIYDLFYKIFC